MSSWVVVEGVNFIKLCKFLFFNVVPLYISTLSPGVVEHTDFLELSHYAHLITLKHLVFCFACSCA